MRMLSCRSRQDVLWGHRSSEAYLPVKLCNADFNEKFSASMLFNDPPLSQKERQKIVIYYNSF
ncbi:hypothetical protein M118_1403 [Bacteroides fragilis str. 3783N1-2]|nr:hypothetical protein M118_1403 [Bacteroides fragilis str. 3783N1-2]